MRRDAAMPAELLVLLGEVRDEQIAERFELSCSTIRRTRRDLGLRQPPKVGKSHRELILEVRDGPMREARTPWTEGMRLTFADLSDGGRIDERGMRVRAGKPPHENWPHEFPDLRDYATRMLCLAELARRVDLDPTNGVTWARQHGMWRLSIVRAVEIGTIPDGSAVVSHYFYDPEKTNPLGFLLITKAPGVCVNDPLVALACALLATKESQ